MVKQLLFVLSLFVCTGLTAQKAGTKKSFELFEGIMIDMVWVPAGSFQMGNTSGIEDRWSADETAHKVTLSEGFWMAEYEMTQDIWQAVMGNNPSSTQGDDYPVIDVNWHQTMAFVQTVQRFDPKFNLPTEAQWEHAAKAGTDRNYSLPRDEITWHKSNSGVRIHKVGEKKASLWGLYDMHGNAGEWVLDWKVPFTTATEIDPIGPENGERKLIKGGQFTGRPRHTQSFDRQSTYPETSTFYVGFRLIRTK